MNNKYKYAIYNALALIVIIIPTYSIQRLIKFHYHAKFQEQFWIYVIMYSAAFLLTCIAIDRIQIQQKYSPQYEFISDFKLELMAIILIFVISISYLPNFIFKVNRGVARTTYGLMGPIITFSWQYLMPLLCLDSYIKWEGERTRRALVVFILSLLIAASGGIMSGYKSATIMAIIPLALYINRGKISLKNLIILLTILFVTAIATIYLTTSLKQVGKGIEFLLNRIFVQTGYGLSAAVHDFENGGNLSYIIFEIFGFQLTRAFGIPFKNHMATALSISFYGPTKEVLRGQANVTPSPMGEGIYLFGLENSWIHAIIIGIIFTFVIKKILNPQRRGDTFHRFWLIFFAANCLPILNGTSIFSLVSLPTLVYLTGLMYFVY